MYIPRLYTRITKVIPPQTGMHVTGEPDLAQPVRKNLKNAKYGNLPPELQLCYLDIYIVEGVIEGNTFIILYHPTSYICLVRFSV